MKIDSNSTLLDFARVYDSIIPGDVCDNLITNFQKLQYDTHRWTDYNSEQPSTSPDTEFQRADIDPKSYITLNSFMKKSMENYYQDIGTDLFLTKFNTPLINKYDTGTQMLPHVDHIYSIFQGTKKGIPVLTILGLLNDDFTGGEFVLWDDYVVPLKKGSIIIFPSLFLYPHRVEKVKTGTRYSFVSWAF